VKPDRKRQTVMQLRTLFGVSTKRACAVVQLQRSTFYKKSTRRDDSALRMRLRELATSRPRFGYPRLHVLLRREGWLVNIKRTYRLYREEGLSMRTKKRRKRASHLRVVPSAPTRPNERLSMDFVSDVLDDARRMRILTVVDVFTRERLALEADFSLTATKVTAALERLGVERTLPEVIPLSDVLRAEIEPALTLLVSVEAQIRAARGVAELAREDPNVRRLQTVPGVGPVTATAYVAALDSQARFSSARQVSSYLGLVPREMSSGERQHRGRITKAGNNHIRWLLVQAAWSIVRSKRVHAGMLQLWALQVAQRRGKYVAVVALARKLAGILFAMWRDRADFRSSDRGVPTVVVA